MRKVTTITDLIGHTPLLRYPTIKSFGAKVYLKLERFNPTLSIKDRMALNMVISAEKSGKLHPHGTIIESSSGNAATSLAMIAAVRGYKFIAVVDDHCPQEKINTIQAYGGKVARIQSGTKGSASPDESIAAAEKLAATTPHSYFANERNNSANATAYSLMADELTDQLSGFDTLIGAVGTAGTLCGTAHALRTSGHTVRVVAVEPFGSTFFWHTGSPYFTQDAGRPAGSSMPRNFDASQIDEAFQIYDKFAVSTCVFLAERLGLLVGSSSGSVVYAALKYAQVHPNCTVVAIMPDAGEKYITTVFSPSWRSKRSLDDAGTMKFLHSVTQTSHP